MRRIVTLGALMLMAGCEPDGVAPRPRGDAGARVTPAGASALEQRLLDRVARGDLDAVVELAEVATLDEISQAMAERRPAVRPLCDRGGTTVAEVESEFHQKLDLPRLAATSGEDLVATYCQDESRQLMSARRTDNGWGAPSTLHELEPEEPQTRFRMARLLTTGAGELLALVSTSRYVPGGAQELHLILFRSRNGAEWSRPERRRAPLRFPSSFEAIVERGGALDVVFEEPGEGDSAALLQLRRSSSGAWSDGARLALDVPGLQAAGYLVSDDALHVVAYDARTARFTGTWAVARVGGGWGDMFPVLPRSARIAASEPILLASPPDLSGRGANRVDLYTGATLRTLSKIATLEIPDVGLLTYRNSTPFAWAPGGAPITVFAADGVVYLLRPADGEAEAYPVAVAGVEAAAEDPQIVVAHGRVHVLWTVLEARRGSLRHCAGELPSDGWMPLGRALWASAEGVGLGPREVELATQRILEASDALRRAGQPRRALTLCLAVASPARPGSGCPGCQPLREIADEYPETIARDVSELLAKRSGPGGALPGPGALTDVADALGLLPPQKIVDPPPGDLATLRGVALRYLAGQLDVRASIAPEHRASPSSPRAACLAVGDHRPAPSDVISAFGDAGVPVVAVSDCELSTEGVVLKLAGGRETLRAVRYTAELVRWLGDGDATVNVSFYQSSRLYGRYLVRLARDGAGFRGVESRPLAVSDLEELRRHMMEAD